jgi:hypothetical protein
MVDDELRTKLGTDAANSKAGWGACAIAALAGASRLLIREAQLLNGARGLDI